MTRQTAEERLQLISWSAGYVCFSSGVSRSMPPAAAGGSSNARMCLKGPYDAASQS